MGTLAEVLFSARARRDLRRIDPRTLGRIVSAIEHYAETGVGDVKPVQPLGGLRLRRGDWRVFFRQPNKAIVEVDAILHRREPYRRT